MTTLEIPPKQGKVYSVPKNFTGRGFLPVLVPNLL
jgi:hypothetical protein